jgi:hypothetical protein
VIVWVITLAAAWLPPVSALAQEKADPEAIAIAQSMFEQIVMMRLDGRYDRAVELLNDLIKGYEQSDEILRRAYHHLVTVYVQNGDDEGARNAARAGLERFPDLEADELDFPRKVNDVYNEMRREMFGALVIDQPEDCRVYLDSLYVGDTPLRIDLVRVGEYNLTVTKSGYRDYAAQIEIQPELTRDLSGLALERDRAWWWWPAWVGGAAISAVALAIGLSGGGDEPPPEEQPLPPPPDRPTR